MNWSDFFDLWNLKVRVFVWQKKKRTCFPQVLFVLFKETINYFFILGSSKP